MGNYRESEWKTIGVYTSKAKVVQNSKLALDDLCRGWREADPNNGDVGVAVNNFSDPPDNGTLFKYRNLDEITKMTIEKIDLCEMINKPYVKPEEPEYEDEEIPWLSAADVEAWNRGRSR